MVEGCRRVLPSFRPIFLLCVFFIHVNFTGTTFNKGKNEKLKVNLQFKYVILIILLNNKTQKKISFKQQMMQSIFVPVIRII